MSSNNQTEPLFEVAVRVTREPLPPCWKVIGSNLNAVRVVKIARKLESAGNLTLIINQKK